MGFSPWVTDAAAGFVLRVYPACGEGVVYFRAAGRRAGSGGIYQVPQLDHGEGGREACHVARAVARGRRYAVANGCSVMLTLGYGDVFLDRASDYGRAFDDLRAGVRRLRRAGGALPYLGLLERQPKRSAREGVPVFNPMVLVPRLERPVLESVRDSWRYGLTDWREFHSGGAGAAAGYAFKYVSKFLAADVPAGRQSYTVGEGFQPQRVESEWGSLGEAVQAALLVGLSDVWEVPGGGVWLLREAVAA